MARLKCVVCCDNEWAFTVSMIQHNDPAPPYRKLAELMICARCAAKSPNVVTEWFQDAIGFALERALETQAVHEPEE